MLNRTEEGDNVLKVSKQLIKRIVSGAKRKLRIRREKVE